MDEQQMLLLDSIEKRLRECVSDAKLMRCPESVAYEIGLKQTVDQIEMAHIAMTMWKMAIVLTEVSGDAENEDGESIVEAIDKAFLDGQFK